jgi:hypothetical protein
MADGDFYWRGKSIAAMNEDELRVCVRYLHKQYQALTTPEAIRDRAVGKVQGMKSKASTFITSHDWAYEGGPTSDLRCRHCGILPLDTKEGEACPGKQNDDDPEADRDHKTYSGEPMHGDDRD